jgi:hypothetical protein
VGTTGHVPPRLGRAACDERAFAVLDPDDAGCRQGTDALAQRRAADAQLARKLTLRR